METTKKGYTRDNRKEIVIAYCTFASLFGILNFIGLSFSPNDTVFLIKFILMVLWLILFMETIVVLFKSKTKYYRMFFFFTSNYIFLNYCASILFNLVKFNMLFVVGGIIQLGIWGFATRLIYKRALI